MRRPSHAAALWSASALIWLAASCLPATAQDKFPSRAIQYRFALPGGRGVGHLASPARRAPRRAARHPVRHREPADRRRRRSRQGRARLAAGRPYAGAAVERHRGQRRAVQEAALRPACGFRPRSGGISDFSYVFLTNAKSELRTLQDVIAAARANPGKLNFGTAAAGTSPNSRRCCFARSPASISRWCRSAARPT